MIQEQIYSLRKLKKIVIIESSVGTTGAFKSILLVAEALRDEHDFHFLIPKGASTRHILLEKKFKVSTYSYLPLTISFRMLFYPLFILSQLLVLKRVLKNEREVIIHCNDIINLLGVVSKLIFPRIRLIYHIRLMPNSYISTAYPILRRLILKYSDRIIAVSNGVKKGFSSDAEVIHDAYQPGIEDFRNDRLDQSPVVFLYLANYTDGKGHEMAIKAFSESNRKISCKSKMIMIGGTFGKKRNREYKEKLLRLVYEYQLEAKVEIRDAVQNVVDCYLEASVFLNFSESEAFPITNLDAMVLGVPIISTRSGGPNDSIENGKTGILINIGDIDSAAESMTELAHDIEKRKVLAHNARKFALKEYSIGNCIKLMRELYG